MGWGPVVETGARLDAIGSVRADAGSLPRPGVGLIVDPNQAPEICTPGRRRVVGHRGTKWGMDFHGHSRATCVCAGLCGASPLLQQGYDLAIVCRAAEIAALEHRRLAFPAERSRRRRLTEDASTAKGRALRSAGARETALRGRGSGLRYAMVLAVTWRFRSGGADLGVPLTGLLVRVFSASRKRPAQKPPKATSLTRRKPLQ